jgi:hypothetical protein
MELRILLLDLLGPFKFEIFLVFILVALPIIFFLLIVSNKLEKFIYLMINWTTSRAPTIENISLTTNFEYFKGTIYSNNIHIGDLLGLVYLFLMIAKKDFRKYLTLVPEGTIPLLLYVLCSSASYFAAPEWTSERSVYAITLHVRQLLFFYCLSNYLRIPMRREYQLKSFFWIAIYTTYVCIHQRYILGMRRVAGDFSHPNGLVLYLVPIIVIFTPILFNIRKNGYNRSIAIITVVASIIPCLLTISRGMIIHAGVGLITVILLDFTFKFNVKKPFIIFSTLLFMTIISAKAWDTWYERMKGASNPQGTAERKAYYIIGWEVFKENKYLGIGINQFGSNAYKIDIIDKVLEYEYVRNDPIVYHVLVTYKFLYNKRVDEGLSDKFLSMGGTPESFYVLHFAETGLVGIFGTLFCQIFFIISAFRSVLYFRKRNIFYYSISVGLVGAQAGVYAQSVLEFILRQENPMYLQAILFAMVSSIASVRRSKKFHNVDLTKDISSDSIEEPPPITNLS